MHSGFSVSPCLYIQAQRLEQERQLRVAVEAAAEALRLAHEEQERIRKYDVIALPGTRQQAHLAPHHE